MFQAVGSVYANMFSFSGRARRAEYWWFVLFTYLVMFLIQGGFAYWLFTSPEFSAAMGNPQGMDVLVKRYEDQVWRWSGLAFVAMLFLYWIPQLAVTVRRLHDTGRSGWWMFKPILIGIAAGGGILFAVAMGYYLLTGKEGMGGGDIKLLAMIGADRKSVV